MTYTAVIADDDALVRHVLRCALEQRGYAVREAADGEALLNCTGSDIDLVLMDASMPGPPLGERLGRMRAVAPHGRIVVMSGRTDASGEARVNGVSFLVKPVTLEAFEAELARVRPAGSATVTAC